VILDPTDANHTFQIENLKLKEIFYLSYMTTLYKNEKPIDHLNKLFIICPKNRNTVL